MDIATTASHFVVPKSLGTFVEGRDYFHWCIPTRMYTSISTVRSVEEESEADSSASIRISYKQGTINKINTLRPMVEISYQAGIFSPRVRFKYCWKQEA